MTNKTWDRLMNFWIRLLTAVTLLIIAGLLIFVFYKGAGLIKPAFFTNDFDEATSYAQFELPAGDKGITVSKSAEGFVIEQIARDSALHHGVDSQGTAVEVKAGDLILSVDKEKYDALSAEEFEQLLAGLSGETTLKVRSAGGGIWPMLVTTLLTIGLTLLAAVPVGICAAVYLSEYAKQGRLVQLIRFSIECLAGIPSIIYGLFGMLFFVTCLRFNYSVLAGILTVSIILLPIIIRTTEEALRTVPVSYREGSLALGATKLETIVKLVVPNALPGILTAVVLSIGRVIGESAALLLTAGTVARIPNDLFQSASTLTVKAYTVAKETADIEMACAIGCVIIVIVLILNFCTRLLQRLGAASKGGKQG